jgi:hypothetical protein
MLLAAAFKYTRADVPLWQKNHQLDGSRFIKKRQVYQHPKPDFRTKYSTGCNFSKKGSISNLATF